nr:expressed protein [Hymenolepis microstoma]
MSLNIIRANLVVCALKQHPLLEMNSLAAAFFGLIGSSVALTLEEAMKNPEENILYDTTPYSIAWQAGLGSFVTLGSLIALITFIALGTKINGTPRRSRSRAESLKRPIA